jgi:glycosyltransferase involved in cell wall biosynthesis
MPDALVAPTPFAARLAARYTRRPIHVVSNGIRLPQTGPEDRERAVALRERLLDGRRFLISHVGRLSHEKRPEGLLELASALAASRQDICLAVAGGGPLRHDLERRAARLGLAGKIRFLCYVSEQKKNDLLRASALFLMTSPTELQSIATLEAMAHGCPVAAAGFVTSAVPELVREADAGLCYDPGRLPEAATEIARLLDNPERLRRLGENAIRAAKSHDIRKSACRLEGLYQVLIQARSRVRR